MAPQNDIEAGPASEKVVGGADPRPESTENATKPTLWTRIMNVLASNGDFELRGCQPVLPEDRTETKYFNIFTLWFSMSCNPLPYVGRSFRALLFY